MLELYIFNKQGALKDGLTSWESSDENALLNSLVFTADKFKIKDTHQQLVTELAQELNYIYKENLDLKELFKELNGNSLDIKMLDGYHHLLSYSSPCLILDSKIINQLAPLYLFAVYYGLARQTKSEDFIYRSMYKFFLCFDYKSIDTVIKYLERDQVTTNTYDAGRHLYDYMNKVLSSIKDLEAQRSDPGISKFNGVKDLEKLIETGFHCTQLFRNRALAGRLPFDLKSFETISKKYIDDAFGGDASQEYFEVFKTSFDENYARKYYRHLVSSLREIGLGVVAQRGSRVAHEQGPVLVNSTTLRFTEDFSIRLRKSRSAIIENISKLEENITKFFKLNNSEKKVLDEYLLNINVDIENFLYLSSLSDCPKARFEKGILELKRNISKSIDFVLDIAKQKLSKKEVFLNFYDITRTYEKHFVQQLLEIEDTVNSVPGEKKKAVVYVQRPSSRSAHFIPRIIMGQKLYIETDLDSEYERNNAIPYNFVCPEFDLIADGIDAFFENASISIVTDRKTGKPDIKWENAEDLAISLAPGMYRAIKAAQENGTKFHYQLETTLFGPLIELFVAILENEISSIASIETHSLYKNQLSVENFLAGELTNTANPELAAILNRYSAEIMEAAAFVFKYYLLESELENYMLQEGISKDKACFEMILSLRDVQKDVAKYCLLKRNQEEAFAAFVNYAKDIESRLDMGYKDKADAISAKLDEYVSNSDSKIFVKKYIRYPESTARKELLNKNPQINRITISSNKKITGLDYYYDFTVAPSRIDFGKHVVASITTLMGRMLGANDLESLNKGKEYIDLVSRTTNSFFESAAEAGSVKVIENTCRALQYAKAISFQGVFQSFDVDGMLARMTINARSTKAAGIHIMEYGTMASTGYCITKEPLFILLGLAINSETLLDHLGVENLQAREELRELMQELLAAKKNFSSSLDWQVHIYEELSSNSNIQKYLSNPDYKWLPRLETMVALFKYISNTPDQDALMAKTYSQLASKLVEFARVINETGIIQRTQIMNSSIRRAKLKLALDKDYSKLRIAFNASYKGNVSDERENANQYLIALLLHQKQYLKNVSTEEVGKLVDYQISHYPMPLEIRVFDPYVDQDTFMGGELKARAEACLQKLVTLKLKTPLTEDIVKAAVVSYGSDYRHWRILNKRLAELDAATQSQIKSELDKAQADFKYLETFIKGFYKDPLLAYQSIDAIQLNSEHDQLVALIDDLPKLKALMQINNPDSLLVLIDNPQQAKRPLLDYDKTLEWSALGGTIGSHQISDDRYEKWRSEIEKQSNWAKSFIQKLIFLEESKEHPQYLEISAKLEKDLKEKQRYADLERDLIVQKFKEAQEMGISLKSQKRYKEWIECLGRIGFYQSVNEITFDDWLILGGRWVLNGQDSTHLNYVIKLFENSQELRAPGKRGFEVLDLYVKASYRLEIDQKIRVIEKAGSTKEADLLVSSAADSLEYRAQKSKASQAVLVRAQIYNEYQVADGMSVQEKEWDKAIVEYIDLMQSEKHFEAKNIELNKQLARLLKILSAYSKNFTNLVPELDAVMNTFVKQKEADAFSLLDIFGDHKKQTGIFAVLASKVDDSKLAQIAKFGEFVIDAHLIMLTVGVEDENEIINKLAIFFDQYLNIHEEDYPPYMFHSLCAGASFGFTQTYYLDPNLRTKMFKLACKAGIHTYKLLQYLLSHKSVLKYSSQEYRDAVIGDYDSGMIPIGYQHEGICIEERFWDCMRALRNFVRNYHDKHPLPIVLKSQEATVTKLFRYGLDTKTKLCFIAGISNIGKHSWDLNCVFRSPKLRRHKHLSSEGEYINISIFTPYLSTKGEIKQIYTAFDPELIEKQELKYLAPFAKDFQHPIYSEHQVVGNAGSYLLNDEGFVHALVMLDPEIGPGNELILPKPNITMSAHTHPQYINGFTAELNVPEVWSMLSMVQMYSKTEVPKILEEIGMESLIQIEFYEKEFNDKESIAKALDERIKAKNCEHIDFWLLKASRDSGGRGISGKVNRYGDKEKIIDFIFQKTRTDDLVMQEFVPNNARAFIKTEFLEKIEDAFVESGINIDRTTPFEQIFFATRSFQSISGIKGYLFSANIGSVTVNAGQGAKMFYGEPSYIMPLYIASKLQKLLDEQGEAILKEAIPKHALKFAKANDINIIPNNIGTNNSYMLNGLFDYIPFVYAKRDGRKFKVVCEDNSAGGLDYYYSYYGTKILLARADTHKASVDAIEQVLKDSAGGLWTGPETEIDLDLAKIEFNSGLGQANLLQKTIEDMAPENKDLFLEWTEDLGAIAMKSLIIH